MRERWRALRNMPGGRTFLIVWFGQFVSGLGSGITGFAMGIWVYETTGSATVFSLTLVSAVVPGLVLSPVAGVLADRWDRRSVMLLSDLVATLRTVALAVLLFAGVLAPWHLYLTGAIASIAGAIRRPAYDAALPLLVPREHLSRANGLVESGGAAGEIASPLLAGVLLSLVGLGGIFLFDLATFAFAVLTLASVRFPGLAGAGGRRGPRRSFRVEALEGWTWIHARRGLVLLLAFFAVLNFCLNFLQALTTPLVLSFASRPVLGFVASFASAGMLLGGVVMTSWRGPSRLIKGVLGSGIVMACGLILAGLRPSVVPVALGLFAVYAIIPVGNACSRTIWQLRVPAELQGRIFATRAAIAMATVPVAFLAAGPLADRAAPALARAYAGLALPGAAASAGAGRGIGLLLVAAGVALLLITLLALRSRALLGVQDEFSDAPAAPHPLVAAGAFHAASPSTVPAGPATGPAPTAEY